MPTVSIIIPVYKAEHYLTLVCAAWWAELYRPGNTGLVDDGSPDRSPEM